MDFRKLDRRSFLAGAGAAAAVTGIAGSWRMPAYAAAPLRKTVMVAGRRVRMIDIHAHCVVPAVADVVRGSGLVTGEFTPDLIPGPDRLAAMDRRGIDMGALSINTYWWYGANRDLAARIVRVLDDGVAGYCKANPDRFVGLSSVSLQFPDLAAEQLDYAVKTLGFRGASVTGHIMGEAPSTEKFDPFWRKAEELQVPVFMHPNNGDYVLNTGAIAGRGDLRNIIGNPFDTTLFLSKLIFDGVFDRFPRLQVCGSHGGGYLPSYFGRTEIACEVRPAPNCLANRKPARDYLKNNIIADTMVFTDEGLRHLVAEMGPDRLVYGSDMPFNWPDTIDLVVNANFLSNAQKEAILGGNLVRLLKIAA